MDPIVAAAAEESAATALALGALAVAVAQETGRFLVESRPVDLGVGTKTSPTDVVTAMDRAAERLIAERILAARPGDAFLGEEGTQQTSTHGVRDSAVRWIVDPIDGTVNYLYDVPAWAVSIAAEVDGEVVAGAVVNPRLNETYAAVRGQGATCNGEPLSVTAAQVREASDLGRALIATGFGYDPQRRRQQAAAVAELLGSVGDIRRPGAASLDLCAVAAGRVDGYYERGLQPWDHAAGALIAAEAGARVEGLRGEPAGEAMVIAAGPGLFPALHDLVGRITAGRDA